MQKKGLILILWVICMCIIMIAILKLFVYPRRYKEAVENAAKAYSIDPYIIYSIIKQESGFNSSAISNVGACGLMQLMPATALEIFHDMNNGKTSGLDIFDETTNINVGTKYLSKLIERYDGNMYIALAAYNAGMGHVDQWYAKPYASYDSLDKVIENIEYAETKTYVINIVNYYNFYRKLY